MPVPNGMREVKNLMEDDGKKPANIPVDLFRLRPEARKRVVSFTNCATTCHDGAGHFLGYDSSCHEMETWHIGLMFIEYVAGLLLEKAKEANCYAKNKTIQACAFSRNMHLDMLKKLKGDLRELADEIDRIEAREKPTWSKTAAHPTPP